MSLEIVDPKTVADLDMIKRFIPKRNEPDDHSVSCLTEKYMDRIELSSNRVGRLIENAVFERHWFVLYTVALCAPDDAVSSVLTEIIHSHRQYEIKHRAKTINPWYKATILILLSRGAMKLWEEDAVKLPLNVNFRLFFGFNLRLSDIELLLGTKCKIEQWIRPKQLSIIRDRKTYLESMTNLCPDIISVIMNY